jgi:hypothetical protein
MSVSGSSVSLIGNVSRVLTISASPISHTGSTLRTEITRIKIPGGIMGPNGALRLSVLFSMTNSTNMKRFEAEIGGTLDLLSNQEVTSASVYGLYQSRILWNRGSQNSQIVMNSWGGDNTLFAPPDVGTEDMSKDQEIIIYGTLAAATETITLEAYTVEILSP